ncbi:MAG: choice-of-anchor I family protein [Nostocales cyanobacterium 94392]|nr:choice-of-anchor I family protein [Nostocales cyanobacterium 94392]
MATTLLAGDIEFVGFSADGFTVATTPNVQITEYMYDGANREIIEFTNLGSTPVDMTGWSYDDDSRVAGTVSLSAFGIVQPGESVILAEATEADFRTAWGLPATVKVIGGLTANLGRADEINLFDNNNQLVDRLTYGDAVFPSTIRTQNASGWTEAGNLAATEINNQWVLSTVGDAQNSRSSTGGDIGNPGSYLSSSIPTAGVTITQSDGSTNVVEGGATDTYTIVLRKQPTADVTININPDAQTTTTPTTLTFTSSNWNVAQTVTVTAVDDTAFEGSHTGAIAHTATSTDASYNGISIPNVTANITDNDTISNTANIQITEYMYSGDNGEFVEFTNLDTTPIDMTGWSFADSNRTAGTFSLSAFGIVQPGESVILTETAEATFRTAWGLPASVKVIGGQTFAGLGRSDEINLFDNNNQLVDRLTYGDERFAGTIRTQNVSGWTEVENLAATDINAQWVLSAAGDAQNSYASAAGDIGNPGIYNTTSTPTAGVTITQSEGSTNVTEGDATDTYTVVLKSQPSANVTVNISPDSQTTTNVTALTFTTDNWNVAQTVTVTAVDDPKVESNPHSSSITHTVTSSDTNYNGIAVATVNANVTDNDFGSLKKISSFAGAGAEITAFDPVSQRLFVVDGTANVQIINFSDPTNPTTISAIDLTQYGISANSVAVKNGVVAIAIEATNPNDPGKVGFYDTAGTFIKDVAVGVLPDMVTFSPDGKKVLTANEGQPTNSSDPVGSVSIIDISQGVENATVATASFSSFDGQETTLRNQGVRIFPNKTISEDAEPEYLTFSQDGTQAWVTLQENNAVAVIDIATATVTKIVPLGFVDHSLAGNELDASDRDGGINIKNYPVFGMFMPDAIASFAANNRTYYVTGNEGDTRTEDARVRELTLDPSVFPDAETLKQDDNLGRLTVSRIDGDTDNDSDYDKLFVYGTRSFSIWDDQGELVYNSGADFEKIIAQQVPSIFNSDGTAASFDSRSDNKGPEPEGVAIGVINNRTYAFIGLERVGGVMIYEVTDPQKPQFVEYAPPQASDQAPEGIVFIPASDSPNGKNLLVLSNEVSRTVTTYEVNLPTRIVEDTEFSLISGTNEPDTLIAGLNGFDGVRDTVFTGAGADEIDLFGGSNNRVNSGSDDDLIYVSSQDRVFGTAGNDEFDASDSMGGNRMSGGEGDDTFFLGKDDRALGGNGDDKFFVQSGGDNILAGGQGADQFWIVNTEIAESANMIIDFEIGTDVIGILGAASLGIDANSLVLDEIDGNTEVGFDGQVLAIVNGVTGLDASNASQFVFA